MLPPTPRINNTTLSMALESLFYFILMFLPEYLWIWEVKVIGQLYISRCTSNKYRDPDVLEDNFSFMHTKQVDKKGNYDIHLTPNLLGA